MISRLGLLISRIFGRLMPDPLLLAILLSIATAALAATLGRTGAAGSPPPGAALLAAWWSQGIWSLLAFSMQMCLILVTGSAIADSPIVRRWIEWIASRPRDMPQAAALVAATAIWAGLLNWGLGLVVGALLARATARSLAERGRPCHYPLLAGSGYLAMLLWHGGLSGSAPLAMTTREGASKVIPASVLDAMGPGEAASIPLSETLFSPLNLVITLGLAAILPVVMAALAPRDRREMLGPKELGIDLSAPRRGRDAPGADPAERGFLSVALAVVLGVALLGGFAQWAMRDGLMRLGIDQINALALGLGLLLHGSALGYARSCESAIRGCVGILLQFPLYGGILGLLKESGLIAVFAEWSSALATPATLAPITAISAGVVNLFVPSGGGQWAVQGPIALEAGIKEGVPLGTMTLAVAYGDQLTNMLQPFWALPLLAITGVKARDLVGYCAIAMIVAGGWMFFWLWLLGR
ncbi:MAG: short-chain fatty acid transporter [Phycisphaerae bacterium]|nr:short-chain fatty acid transporter [Phycisphaerae bacterium]